MGCSRSHSQVRQSSDRKPAFSVTRACESGLRVRTPCVVLSTESYGHVRSGTGRFGVKHINTHLVVLTSV